MRFIRNFFRKLKYKIRFLGKNNQKLVNYFVSSNITNKKLTELMNYYGSDKGGVNKDHNFSDYYSEIFFHKKNDEIILLEVGLGSNNLTIPSNMGADGSPLASLRAWRDYFKNGKIYGADIDKDILKNEERIKTYFVDQREQESINNLFKNINEKKFDIIIDDGLHEYSANICLLENSFKYLNSKGIYIIEDVFFKDKNKFLNYLKKKNYNFSIIDIYHEYNISNNCLITIYK